MNCPILDERSLLKEKLQSVTGDSFLSTFTEDPFKSAYNVSKVKRDKLKKYIVAGQEISQKDQEKSKMQMSSGTGLGL